MSSRTWTPSAVASEASRQAGDAWRAVEAQHVVSTMALVDTLDEQALLEDLLEASKPAWPEPPGNLHYLLATPFRYRPPRGGSRFRGESDDGVFYAADAVRTACAELGYWRWRHLADSPALDAMPPRAQTVMRVALDGAGVDLRAAPFDVDRARWTDPDDYAACQAFARVARNAQLGILRYESVRDPERGGCVAALRPAVFAKPKPLDMQTWTLSVTRDRVVWHRAPAVGGGAFEFDMTRWHARAAARSTSRRPGAPRRRTRKP